MRCVLPICLLLTIAAFAQPPDSVWSRTYGGPEDDRCYAADTVSGSGFILGGMTQRGAEQFAFIVRTDARGDTLWTRALFPSRVSMCHAICALPDGGFAAAGYMENSAAPHLDAWLLLLTAAGDTARSRIFSTPRHDELYSVAVASGGLLLTGSRQLPSGEYAGWAVQTDIAGNVQWDRSYGGGNSGLYAGVALENGAALAGYADSGGQSAADFYLVRVGSSGDTLWTRRHDAGRAEICTALRIAAGGGFLLAGGRELPGGGGADGLVLQTDSLGTPLWSRTFGGEGYDWFADAQPAASGAWLLAGSSFSASMLSFDVWMVEVSATGDSLWGGTFGHWLSSEYCLTLCRTPRGYAAAGHVRPFDSNRADIWLLKFGDDSIASVNERPAALPLALAFVCIPNPFNSRAQLRFALTRAAPVELALFDVAGRRVATLLDERLPAGEHALPFDGRALASGIYFARLTAAGHQLTHKLLLIK